MGEFTHFNKEGNAVMVDVHAKDDTYRVAVAAGKIYVNEEVYAAIKGHTAKKGDVLGVARIAGIMAAKKNSELIPLCHIIALTDCEIRYEMHDEEHSIEAFCKTSCIDGGNDRRECDAIDHLRYVQGDGPWNADY